MEREACVCDHGFERSDLCAEIIIIIIIRKRLFIMTLFHLHSTVPILYVLYSRPSEHHQGGKCQNA